MKKKKLLCRSRIARVHGAMALSHDSKIVFPVENVDQWNILRSAKVFDLLRKLNKVHALIQVLVDTKDNLFFHLLLQAPSCE